MTAMSRPTGSRHSLGALFTLVLAVLLYISSKGLYQPLEGSRHAVFRNISQQYDIGLEDRGVVTLNGLEGLNTGFNASPEIVDKTYEELSLQSKYFKREDEQKEAYDKAKCLGIQLLDMLNQQMYQGRSAFNEFEQLQDNGWTYYEEQEPLPRDLELACDSLEISTDQRDNVYISLNQVEMFTNRFGQGNAPTEATFNNYVNVEGHTIAAIDNYGPTYKVKNYPQPLREQRIPDLNRWSDAMWLVWEKHAGDQARELEYIIRHLITTGDTINTIRYILALLDEEVGAYPGITRGFDTDDGLALLGTPNLSGVAWMLYDHRNKIQKRPDFVRIWRYNPNAGGNIVYYNMLLKLKDP